MAEAAKERDQRALCYNDHLPNELLSKVLLNLPAKSVLRFKCVSKQWYSLISDPHFIDRYENCSLTREGGGTIVIPPPRRIRYNDPGLRFLTIDLSKPPHSRATVVVAPRFPPSINMTTNMVNGIICFYDNGSPAEIYLYSLLSREVIVIPPSIIDRKTGYPRYFPYEYRSCYLGFNPTNKEYKVLQFCWDGIHHMFTLGSDSWREIGIDIPRNTSFCGLSSFCVDGVLYFKAAKRGYPMIFAFDVEHETFKMFNYPHDVKESGGYLSPTLAHIQGQVSLLQFGRRSPPWDIHEITVWRLINPKDDDSLNMPLWDKENITCSFGDYPPRLYCNHLGQLTQLKLQLSWQLVIETYDIGTRITKTLEMNNPDEISVKQKFTFEPSRILESITPLKTIKEEKTQFFDKPSCIAVLAIFAFVIFLSITVIKFG